MSHACRDDMTGFDHLLQLPAHHPDRKDVEDCPRCGARLLAYQAFMLAGDVTGADAAAAQTRLTAFIASESASALPQAIAAASARRERWKFFEIRWLVPAAAVLIVAAIGVWRMQPGTDRSTEVRAVGDASRIVLLPAPPVDGATEIAWEPVSSADAYQVRLLGPDFAELRRVGPVQETSIRVESAAASYYQVVALAHGDEVAASPIRRLLAQP